MVLVKQIVKEINCVSYNCDLKKEIERVVSLDEIEGVDNAIAWCSDSNLDKLNSLKTNSVILVSENANLPKIQSENILVVEKPRRSFQRILTKFFTNQRNPEICSSAIVDDSVILGANIFIGHNVVIEKGCEIGDNVSILHNTVILEATKIGNNVSIGSNNTIGGVGFGYEKDQNGDFELIPHLGNVTIDDNVDIGNNVCIDRAVLGSTILRRNVKVDNLVHIAHGVKIGANSVVIANAMIAGSVEIGENCWIAPSASVINKKNIGNNALVGLGAVVTKEVSSSTVVAGNPAKFIKNL